MRMHEGKAEGGPEDGCVMSHSGEVYRMRNGEYHWSEDHECWVWYGFTQEPTPVQPDPTNPAHYKQGKVECIDAIEAAVVNLKGIEAMCTGNAMKYLWRWKEKGGHTDLKKAIWYISRITGD